MTQVKADAQYLFEHFKQSGENRAFADMLYQRLLKQRAFKQWEAVALKNEFIKLLKAEKARA